MIRENSRNGNLRTLDTLSPSGDCEVNFYDSRAIMGVTCVVSEGRVDAWRA